MNGALDAFRKLGPQRLAAMLAVTLALVGFFAFIALRVSQPQMATLFADLSLADSTAVTKELDLRGVRYELRGDGSSVLVPRDNLLRLRMDLAGKGLPSGGGVGYEIFDKGDAFSSTSFVQGVNQLRALEGELSRTIRSLDRVATARVHLVLPERQLFSREKKEPRASIVVKVRGELEPAQVRAIRHLVASAVEGLKPERVSLVDEGGRLLADGAGSDDPAITGAERQQGLERRMRAQVEDIVASVVGQGRARVQLSAEMDFNRVQQTSESYDPEGRVVRSTQTRSEQQTSNEAKEGGVSVSTQLPGGEAGAAGAAREATAKTEETTNYEISRTTRTEVNEGGRVKRLSVAVLVDGTYARGPDGALAYEPREAGDLERIAALVRSSIGFDARRGDAVEVVNLRFAEAPRLDAGREPTAWERLLAFTKDDVVRFTELGVFGALSLVVLLFVVRPMLRRMWAPERAAALALPGGVPALAGPAPATAPAEDAMLEFSQVNGGLKAGAVEKVGEVVNRNQQETVAILRQWIHGT